MSRRLSAVVGAAVLVSVALAAGCGGSSSGSSSGSTAAATTEATSTAARERPAHEGAVGERAGEPHRLPQGSRECERRRRTKCLHRAKSAENFQNIPKTQACVGDVFTELQKAAGDSLAVLQGFTAPSRVPARAP